MVPAGVTTAAYGTTTYTAGGPTNVGSLSINAGEPSFNLVTTGSGPNLLSANVASIEGSDTGWQPTACTIAQSNAEALSGNFSLSVISTAGGNVTASVLAAYRAPVVPGQSYSALASIMAATTGRTVELLVAFYTAGGAQIGSVTIASITDETTDWTTLFLTGLIAPSTAATMSFSVQFNGTATSEVHYLDCAGVFEGTTTSWTPPPGPSIIEVAEAVQNARAILDFDAGSSGYVVLTPTDDPTNNRTKLAIDLSSNAQTALAAATASTPRQRVRDQARGFGGQVWENSLVNLGSTAPATQALYGTLAGFLAGDVITNIIVAVATAGAGTTPTGIYLALYSASGALEAETANLAASAIWTPGAGAGYAVCTLSSPFTVPSTAGYYLTFVQNGTWGTTQLKLISSALGSIEGSIEVSGYAAACVKQTAQATPPSPATLGGSTENFWFAWS
jgi:hypothetical protein